MTSPRACLTVYIPIFSDCCDIVEVAEVEGRNTGAKQHQPQIFTTYTREPNLHQGKALYTSADKSYRIAVGNGNWEIQSKHDG